MIKNTDNEFLYHLLLTPYPFEVIGPLAWSFEIVSVKFKKLWLVSQLPESQELCRVHRICRASWISNNIKFRFKLQKSAKEAYAMLQSVYANNVMTLRTVYKWCYINADMNRLKTRNGRDIFRPQKFAKTWINGQNWFV